MFETIAVAGLGLIGGSVAKALKTRGDCRVLGYDIDEKATRRALETGAVDALFSPARGARTPLLVLALPPAACVAFLQAYARAFAPGTVVTDVCGVKRAVVGPCERLCEEAGLRFVGGHPMAGRETGGFENALAGLFEGASYILTPTARTDPQAQALVEAFAHRLGAASITRTTPEQHDRMIAFTSQLPHVLAGAYVRSPAVEAHEGFSAGSYSDVSRVASVDEGLWHALFLANADYLCEEIDCLIGHLSEYRDALAAADAARIRALVRIGRQRKQANG